MVEEKITSKIQTKFQKIQSKLDHILFFRFKILKWTVDKFGSAGWIVEVLTELLTPILARALSVGQTNKNKNLIYSMDGCHYHIYK